MRKKASRIDYSKAMLPRTRRAQFLDCFKLNFLIILKCGLMLLLFFAPLIGFCFFMDFYYVSLIQHATQEVEQTKLIYYYIYCGGCILLSLVAVIGVSGVLRVYRTLIWGEGIFFKDDFGNGIKQNTFKNVIFAAIFGVLFGVSYFIYSLFPETIISAFGMVLCVVVFLPIYFWLILLNNTYSSSGFGLLRNGMYFFIKTIGWSLLGILMPLLPVALIAMPFELVWLRYIILVAYIVLLLPIALLIMVLFSTAKFDEAINKENYPDFYLKGLNHD